MDEGKKTASVAAAAESEKGGSLDDAPSKSSGTKQSTASPKPKRRSTNFLKVKTGRPPPPWQNEASDRRHREEMVQDM